MGIKYRSSSSFSLINVGRQWFPLACVEINSFSFFPTSEDIEKNTTLTPLLKRELLQYGIALMLL